MLGVSMETSGIKKSALVSAERRDGDAKLIWLETDNYAISSCRTLCSKLDPATFLLGVYLLQALKRSSFPEEKR